MATPSRTPWEPDPAWAAPLLPLLAILACLLVVLHLIRPTPKAAPAHGLSHQARMADWAAGLQSPARRAAAAHALENTGPWERALAATWLAEDGQVDEGARLLADTALDGEGATAFRQAWEAAYRGGPAPTPANLDLAARTLGDGHAAQCLRSRLGEPQALKAWRQGALLKAAAFGFATLLGGTGALAYALLAFLKRRSLGLPSPSPLSGRTLALVLLLWFLGMQLSGIVAGTLLLAAPVLRPYGLPIQYGLHASLGLALVCAAEGRSLGALLRDLSPTPFWKALLHGLGGFALAGVSIFLLGLLLGPFMPKDAAPQRVLLDTMAGTRGWLPVALLFATVAGLAPFFEEVLFRGVLLRWLEPRMRWPLALLVSGLAFGAIHLQPLAMPTLSVLGMVLGLVFMRSRNLWAAILIHGLWNGGLFLAMRL